MADRYWVVGGEYTDTSFSELADGAEPLRLGPFDDYKEAVAVWRAKAMETIDEAYTRFEIEREEATEFWVIGGVYTDTDFKTTANGEPEERHGPYPSHETAEAEWRRLAMLTIDDAYARYRIDKL